MKKRSYNIVSYRRSTDYQHYNNEINLIQDRGFEKRSGPSSIIRASKGSPLFKVKQCQYISLVWIFFHYDRLTHLLRLLPRTCSVRSVS